MWSTALWMWMCYCMAFSDRNDCRMQWRALGPNSTKGEYITTPATSLKGVDQAEGSELDHWSGLKVRILYVCLYCINFLSLMIQVTPLSVSQGVNTKYSEAPLIGPSRTLLCVSCSFSLLFFFLLVASEGHAIILDLLIRVKRDIFCMYVRLNCHNCVIV